MTDTNNTDITPSTKKKDKILITSALPYVNNVPHLGNIVGAVLSADVFARFCRSFGHETLYVCGTDEHGTATETKALEEGVTPQEICDKYYKIHKDIYDWFSISFDKFGRTSTEEQTELTQKIFRQLRNNGYIAEDEVEQLYCESCEKFLADRFVEGTCPLCGFDDARGDQCDGCGKLLNATELINPRCKVCDATPVVRKSNHLFIDLPKLQPKLKEWVDKRSVHWSQNAKTITNAWIKEGLKKRAITRDLKWGVAVPHEGFEDKVFYVWFDAPIGYLSITKKEFGDSYESWWHNNYDETGESGSADGAKLYQFMGKDNVPFHTVIFPSSLLGSEDNYTMLYKMSSTEYLNYEDTKFSKSRGIGVFGNNAKDSGIASDVFRYYLLRNRPEKSDSVFSWNDFLEKNNNELVANVGNLINRTLTFLDKNYDRVIPSPDLKEIDEKFLVNIAKEEKKATELLEKVELKEGLKQIMHISKLGNQYFQEKEPWKKIKGEDADKKDCDTTMYVLCQLVKDLAILIEPYLPVTSEKIFKMLLIGKKGWDDLGQISIEAGHECDKPEVLFAKLDKKKMDELREMYGGQQKAKDGDDSGKKAEEESENVFPLKLKTGRIVSVEDHPDADKLYVVKVELGDEERQVCAGLKAYMKPEEMMYKQVVLVANLKAAKLRGVMSQGMLLAADAKDAEGNEIVRLVDSSELQLGDLVKLPGKEVTQKEIDIKKFMKFKLSIQDKKLHFNGETLESENEPGKTVGVDIADGSKVR